LVKPDASPPLAPAPPGFTALADGVSVFRDVRRDESGAVIAWLVARLDLDKVRLAVRGAQGMKLEALASEPDIALAVNGGFFDPSWQPSGLLVSEGKTVTPWREGGGSGALVVQARRATMVSAPPADVTPADLVVQCGPRLVETRGKSGIRKSDGKRAERTAVCIRDGGRELNVVVATARAPADGTGDGPTLFELARWLVAPLTPSDKTGCDVALNLDGGPSTGVVGRSLPRPDWVIPRGPVPWAIAVVRRTP
jgi:uncharacterized protein YigE (DUF2233 family)